MSLILKKNINVVGSWERWWPDEIARETHLVAPSFYWHIEGNINGKIRWTIEAHDNALRAQLTATGAPHLSQGELGVIDQCMFAVEGASTLSKVLLVIQEFFNIPKPYESFLQQSAYWGNYCHVYNPNPLEQLVYFQGKLEEGTPVLSEEVLVLLSPDMKLEIWKQDGVVLFRLTCHLPQHHDFSQALLHCVRSYHATPTFWIYETTDPSSELDCREKQALWNVLSSKYRIPQILGLAEHLEIQPRLRSQTF